MDAPRMSWSKKGGGSVRKRSIGLICVDRESAKTPMGMKCAMDLAGDILEFVHGHSGKGHFIQRPLRGGEPLNSRFSVCRRQRKTFKAVKAGIPFNEPPRDREWVR